MGLGRNKPLGVSLQLDPSDFERGLREVDRRVTSTAREMEGALGRALRDTTQDLRKLGDKAPGVAASMLRLEDAQNQYNRALAKHGEESRQAKLALARVADQQDKVRVASDKAARSVDHATDEIARQGRVSKATTLGLSKMRLGLIGLGTAAGYSAVRGITASISAASDLNEEVSKTKTVFGDASKQVLAFSETTARTLGISQRAALESAGQFGNMLTPMGIARDRAAEMSVAMVKLSGDMASFNNASPEDTLQAIQSGLAGETEPLRKYGVFLDAARIKAEAMSSGLVKSQKDMVLVREAQVKLDEATQKLRKAQAEHGAGSIEVRKAQIAETKATRKLKEELKGHNVELTAAQKAQASYNLIMKDTKVQQGDAARTGDQLAGLQRKLSASTEELAARFGAKLLPSVVKVAKFMLGNWPKIERAVDAVGVAAGGLIEFMANVVTGRWKEAWNQILSAVEQAKGPMGTAARAVGREIARGLVEGFDAALASIPGSGAIRRFLGTGGEVNLAQVRRTISGGGLSTARAGGTGGGGFGAVTGRTMGGFTPGPYRGRDYMLTALDGNEAVLNPTQISMVPGGRATIADIFRRTGGKVGGGAFSTGGYVSGGVGGNWGGSAPLAIGLAQLTGLPITSQKRTTKYTASGGVSDHWTGSTSSYAVDLGARGAAGDTAANLIANKIGAGSYPGGYWLNHSRDGFRFQLGWKTPGHFDHVHLGVKNAGGGGSALEDILGGGTSGGASGGSSTSAPAGISVKQFTSALAQAKSTGAAGQASRPGLTDVPSVDRRHSDDTLQERVIRRRGGKDSDVYAFQKKEIERDIKDVTKQIRKLVAQRTRLVKLQRTLRRQGASTKTSRVTREAVLERFRNVSQTLTETRDAIATLQQMRREMVLEAKVLGFDVEDALAEEAQEAADQAAEETTDPGLTDAQQSALVNLGAWAQSGEAFARAAGSAGDIGAGGRSGLAAAFNPGGQSININVQAFTPGDASVYRAISETVIRALGTHGNVPATTIATGA